MIKDLLKFLAYAAAGIAIGLMVRWLYLHEKPGDTWHTITTVIGGA